MMPVGAAVQVDHLVPEQVGVLLIRIEREQGGLHILVNDIRANHSSLGRDLYTVATRYGDFSLRINDEQSIESGDLRRLRQEDGRDS